ncbi:MAG: acetate--CoA ligase [Enhygromyxa sp.]
MSVEPIAKAQPSAANMPNYELARAQFDWASARAELDGLPGGGLNIAHEAVMRHAGGPLAETVALRWLGKRGEIIEYSYAELAREVARFANLLDSLGVSAGETLCSFAGRLPYLYVAALGAVAHRSVFCPLFSAFGPEPILARLGPSRAKLVVTTERLYTRKLAPLRDRLPDLEHVLLLDLPADRPAPAGTRSLAAELAKMPSSYTIPPTDPEDPALLHFTSGTTGQPKGALHVHAAVIAHHITGRLALDLRPGDVFWCTADPGWVTGTSYGIIAPLTNGVTMIVDEAEFEARRWYQLLQDQHVTVWYTAPTAIRMLMRAGAELARDYDLSSLRFIASVGEPLNPEAVRWGVSAFGQPIHDNWWQTETGGIMIANYASMAVKPGSMGKPLPGIEAAIVSRDNGDEGDIRVIEEPEVEGELAIRAPWPSMFRAYLDQPERYQKCFAGDWYLSGDLAERDAEGYFWFIGRADDVIKSAGHLIGPFEVESALVEHPAVAEAAVIGKPDELAGAIIKAFVVVQGGAIPDEALRRELIGFSRGRLGPAVAPREIEFCDDLPKTRSGKIMRRLLKARELGLPEGDTSTLESTRED